VLLGAKIINFPELLLQSIGCKGNIQAGNADARPPACLEKFLITKVFYVDFR